jgi:hypothetical protein
MYVCVYVYVYVYIYIYIFELHTDVNENYRSVHNIYVFIRMIHTCMCIYKRTDTYTECGDIQLHARTYTHAYMHTYKRTHIQRGV